MWMAAEVSCRGMPEPARVMRPAEIADNQMI
jgi:hypothetical protein